MFLLLEGDMQNLHFPLHAVKSSVWGVGHILKANTRLASNLVACGQNARELRQSQIGNFYHIRSVRTCRSPAGRARKSRAMLPSGLEVARAGAHGL